jgi:hypothetical protein
MTARYGGIPQPLATWPWVVIFSASGAPLFSVVQCALANLGGCCPRSRSRPSPHANLSSSHRARRGMDGGGIILRHIGWDFGRRHITRLAAREGDHGSGRVELACLVKREAPSVPLCRRNRPAPALL